jgi:DNA-binding MarR family transcriptional regulator
VAAEPATGAARPASEENDELREAWEGFLAATRRARRPVSAPGLSLAQFRLLSPLLDGGPHRVGELADAAEVSGPTATRMLDALERGGLIRRTHGRDDRRHVRISLTPDGQEAVVAKQGRIERARQGVFETLTQEERAHAARFLTLMARAISEL